MKDEIIICDCSSAEHQAVLRYDDDKDLGRMVYLKSTSSLLYGTNACGWD